MAGNFHFTKGRYNDCDKTTEFMKGVISSNLRQQKTVLMEFRRVLGLRSESKLSAIRSIKNNGGLISYQNMKKVETGVFDYVPNTYLNVLSRYCGYEDFVELCIAVRMRESSGK